MKNFILLILLGSVSVIGLAAPTLSASTVQPVYPGTTKPFLNIVSGSGKTSYVSGVLNDPTDPAATQGIYFTVTGAANVSFIFTSSSTSVVPISNFSVSQADGYYIIKIVPIGVGFSNLTIKASDGSSSSSAYKINYAASSASSYPFKTIFPTKISDASGAVSIDDNYMLVADDETNLLRLFSRKKSGIDLYSLDISSSVGASEECDLEGAATSVKFNTGKRVYWIGSLGNSKSGNLKPNRDRVIATELSGTGATTTVSVKGYSAKFRAALISWGDGNSWNFTASANAGMIPKRIDGFNVEGLTVTHGGDTAFVGFRAPCVPIKGTTPNSSNRKYAVVAPITNFETLMNTNGTITTNPICSEPILFDLEGLGIRSVEKVGTSLYLIVAGLYTGGGSPSIYLWDGRKHANPGINPITTSSSFATLLKLNLLGLSELAQVSSNGDAEGHPEAMIAEQIGEIIYIHLISDNGTVDYYNSGDEAKALGNEEHKKIRYDNFVYDMTNYTTNCTNGIIQFSTDVTHQPGNTYHWQMFDGIGFAPLPDGGVYSGVNTATLQLSNAPTSMYGKIYRCEITNGSTISYSSESTLQFKAYWKGTVSNAWENPQNWGCNLIPDAYTDVYIQAGAPVLSTSTSIRSITIKPIASIIINNNAKLAVLH